MRTKSIDPDVSRDLVAAATALGLSQNDVLRRVLNSTPLTKDPRFASYTDDRSNAATLWEALDNRLRALNPGLHYVFRANYVGYRRAGKDAPGPLSERSQIFVSVLA